MYIYGKNVVTEKINSNEKINKVYLSDKFSDKELFKLIKDRFTRLSEFIKDIRFKINKNFSR